MLQRLLGTTWAAFFPEGRLQPDEVIPRHVASYVRDALASLHVQAAPSPEVKRAVEEGLEAIAKRARR